MTEKQLVDLPAKRISYKKDPMVRNMSIIRYEVTAMRRASQPPMKRVLVN